ncbi:NADP-dependent oxidoreductase [Hymenobacter cellulosilyticus]|uniref:NADP-dependent oxidoreductase n=1 Tax=Hymenobacter cellulosilyticus TaxID=2932248 RepID=A0A8T9QA56_9BACT|nr:NADP-dependent oxidoreductase [Hymenobacter cellulosilyticus]UOQ72700.1 NADP-dependent oxidoreductase [Hymenobacter cellulosilyticus]
MKAYILHEPTGPSGLRLTELPTPTPAATDVLLRVQALSVNPVDAKSTEGKAMYGHFKDEQPLILGWDVAGTVEAVGAEVTTLQPGDEVFGMINFPGHARAYAEYVAAPAAHLVRKPATTSTAEAAAATLAALTAWQALVTQANLQAGQRVLIHAAAGGVGHYAVQLAKHLGAYVIGTASAAKRDFALSLGADEVIDYQQQAFEQVLEPVDVVLDCLSGETQLRSLEVLKPGGTLVSILGLTPDTPTRAEQRGVTAKAMLVDSNQPGMQEVADLLASGALRSHVSLTVPFAELPRALEQILTGSTQGKVVITL